VSRTFAGALTICHSTLLLITGFDILLVLRAPADTSEADSVKRHAN
jgi:hypothetical protein